MSYQIVRRGLVASILVLAGAVVAAPAMADSVTLGGSVADTSAVTSTATAAAAALPLSGVGTAGTDTVVKVADMALLTNNASGVTLTAEATGDLVNAANPATPLPYNVLIVADAATTPAAADFAAATSATKDDEAVTNFVAGAAARDLYIQYDAPALLDPGTYAGSITVSVAAL
ncbi:MAG: hypothetical protein HY785_05355 [Oscillatoriophycideae cyanobacterium NC_groundwater_1537_Pr4_S-0.65um_50_18]|nr:hypothetical protein [Oscillatoriophycideae cyanobacterium NC_groundwater_1537_Pr4_S-0.65um_50_18]